MWLVLKLFGFEVFAFGVSPASDGGGESHYISNSGGSFELAPDEYEDVEWEEEGCSFGFR
jgi:hypothetical protein